MYIKSRDDRYMLTASVLTASDWKLKLNFHFHRPVRRAVEPVDQNARKQSCTHFEECHHPVSESTDLYL